MEMLRCFTTVVTQGNLGDAAAALRRTPSAVSMMLKQFEDHVGAPLFETGRKSRLTPLGALIYDEARREVAHFDTTLAAIEGIARAKQGHLRLAVIPSVATAILPEVVAEYIRDFPDIQIDVRDMDSAAIAVELAAGRADVGIGTLPDAPDMTRETLFSDVFGVVCHKGHPLAQGEAPVTWGMLAHNVFIANGLCDHIDDPAFVDIVKNSNLMVPNTASLLGLVRQGVGVTVLPQLACRGAGDDLVFLELAACAVIRHVHLVSRPDHLVMPAVRAFTTMLRARGLIFDLNFNQAE